MQEIKKCPHCGGESVVTSDRNGLFIECVSCGCRTTSLQIDYRDYYHISDVISVLSNLWNARKDVQE